MESRPLWNNNINLKQLIMQLHEDYQGTISLKNNMGYQEVYSSQNYGTFYSLYIRLNIDKKTSGSDDEWTFSNIEFKIINYKGVINLGIRDVTFSLSSDETELIFEAAVEGLYGIRNMPVTKPAPTFTIDTSKLTKITIQRTLMQMTAFNQDKNPNHEDNLVFDNEFFYRDGLEFDKTINDRKKWGGMQGHGLAISGKRCYHVSHNISL